MKYIIFMLLIVVGFCAMAWLIPVPPNRMNICNVSEISPDVTPEERRKCQMIRGHKL